MSEDPREYNKIWMRQYRIRVRWQREVDRGHCPVCGMLLTSEYHFRCPYLDDPETPR